MSSNHLLTAIRREFEEHPGILVTLMQAQIRWRVDERRCSQAFEALLAEGFLQQVDDAYLWSDAPAPRFRLSRGHGHTRQP